MSSDPTIASELKSNISTLRTGGLIISDQLADDFDHHGTELWNVSTRIRRENDHEMVKLSCLLRVFAFFLLEYAKIPRRRTLPKNVRLLKVGCKTARLCLELHDLDNAQDVLGRAATCEEAISQYSKDLNNRNPKEDDLHWVLEVDYLTLRVMLVLSCVVPIHT